MAEGHASHGLSYKLSSSLSCATEQSTSSFKRFSPGLLIRVTDRIAGTAGSGRERRRLTLLEKDRPLIAARECPIVAVFECDPAILERIVYPLSYYNSMKTLIVFRTCRVMLHS
jgi:hypothetical protein